MTLLFFSPPGFSVILVMNFTSTSVVNHMTLFFCTVKGKFTVKGRSIIIACCSFNHEGGIMNRRGEYASDVNNMTKRFLYLFMELPFLILLIPL